MRTRHTEISASDFESPKGRFGVECRDHLDALAGTATMRTDDESTDLQAGDSYLCRPGLAHQITNDSPADFVYLVMSNDPPHDACYYPDSGKMAPGYRGVWGKMPEAWRFWQPLEGAEYFSGEE